jgi:hypothetical protein
VPGRRMSFKWNCVVRNLFLIAILAVFIAASALTAQPLPAPVLHVEPDLKLLGKGELRWFGLHVYDASLWVGGRPGARIGPMPSTCSTRATSRASASSTAASARCAGSG